MADSDIFIDTTIFINHLRKHNKQKSILYHLTGASVLYTATMVEFELFAGATDKRKLHDVQQVLKTCAVIPLTSAIAQRAGSIYRNLKRRNLIIEIRDIIIAATALEEGLPIMTTNEKHFHRIQGITLLPVP
jgi:tRNA(fMet)-specific endonuclease VapC